MATAVAIISFCRPDYLDKCLSSLEKCNDVNLFDWHFFQDMLDGFPKSKVPYYGVKKSAIDKNIERIKNTTVPLTNLTINKKNEGVNHQINKIFKLFETYDKLFIFEDDLVVSNNYLRLLNRCSEEYPDIVASFHSLGKKNPNLPGDLRKLKKSIKPRLWGFYMTKNSWDKIKKGWGKKYNPNRRTPYYDTTLTQLIKQHTKGKYESVVTRAYNIGVEGILSSNKTSWKHRHLDRQNKRIHYPRDKGTKKFILS